MFVDTNILVAARISNDPSHHAASTCLTRVARSGEPLRLSLQVLREYCSVTTRPQRWSNPLSMEQALGDMHRLLRHFELLEENRNVLATFLALCKSIPSLGKHLHDSNIIATMLAHGETRLLTNNPKDFQRFAGQVELVTPATIS